MKLTVELTMYPLQDNYLDIIRQVVEKLNQQQKVLVKTFPTATILEGDFEEITTIVNETLRWSVDEFGKCVFIAKYIPDYAALSS